LELPHISLEDALAFCLLTTERQPARFERAAARWIARYLEEEPRRAGRGFERRLTEEHEAAAAEVARLCQQEREITDRGAYAGGDATEPFTAFPLSSTPDANARREEVNCFIRESGEFDGVIDFDRAIRSPTNQLAPRRL
jgi:hypothetical protein